MTAVQGSKGRFLLIVNCLMISIVHMALVWQGAYIISNDAIIMVDAWIDWMAGSKEIMYHAL